MRPATIETFTVLALAVGGCVTVAYQVMTIVTWLAAG